MEHDIEDQCDSIVHAAIWEFVDKIGYDCSDAADLETYRVRGKDIWELIKAMAEEDDQ